MKLIVIDMQKALMDDELYNYPALVENVAKVIAAARTNGVEVIYVQHDAGPGTGFSMGDEAWRSPMRWRPGKGKRSL